MRRAEMARRRKNLSEKRNEEEKVHILGLFCGNAPCLPPCSPSPLPYIGNAY